MLMTMDDEIRNEKWQYDINIAAAKVSALSLTKVDKKWLSDRWSNVATTVA